MVPGVAPARALSCVGVTTGIWMVFGEELVQRRFEEEEEEEGIEEEEEELGGEEANVTEELRSDASEVRATNLPFASPLIGMPHPSSLVLTF